MIKIVRWGIIGLGKIANKFATDLQLVENAELHGVASRDTEKARSFAEKYNSTKFYGNYSDLANDPEIDIVYIATPHVFHFENTMLCLKKNKAVLCEKPMGMNTWEVKTMVEEAKSRNVFLMEAVWTRFIPGTTKLLELLESGVIGEIEKIEADFGFICDTDPEGRLYNKQLGGGSLMDTGIYPVYLSLLLMGVPTEIEAAAKFTNTGVDGHCGISLKYLTGKSASLKSSLIEDTPIEAVIYGSKGSIKLHKSFHHTEKISISDSEFGTKEVSINYKGKGYYHEIVDVIDCLMNQRIENEKMPHSMSLKLVGILDEVRTKIGLTYPNEKGVEEA